MRFAPLSGLLGAIATTVLNETFRRFMPYAPRLDILGLRLASAGFQLAGMNPPRGLVVRAIALVGDLVSNSLFFGLIGLGRPRHPLVRGSVLGLAMGIGAVALPEPLGFGKDTTARTKKTAAQTILFYVAGGVLAALAFQFSQRRRNP
jgi:hypothetical protein